VIPATLAQLLELVDECNKEFAKKGGSPNAKPFSLWSDGDQVQLRYGGFCLFGDYLGELEQTTLGDIKELARFNFGLLQSEYEAFVEVVKCSATPST
jgi:hypothetical protein